MDFATWQYLFKYSFGKPGAINAYREAIRNQNLPPELLEELSWNKTLELLNYAYEKVPWYKDRFVSIGLEPGDIKYPEDFINVPVLSRTELAENFERFVSKDLSLRSLKISATGGSTGNPLKIGMDPRGNREVPKWQMLSWWGLTPVSNMASIYRGVPVKGIKKMTIDFINWPQKTLRLDATNITEENIKLFIRAYNKHNPSVIHGYVGALDVLSDYIIEHKVKLKPPKVIWSTASPISEVQEVKIRRAFDAPVCDQYGCSEIFFVAAECPNKQGLHIFSDSVKVEILNEGNQPVPAGTYGKIVLTNLNDYSFPIIRYENGDMGRLLNKKCSCGLSLPLMDKVKGRISDNIILPDGTVLAGEYLTTIFDDYASSVKQFQIIQHKSSDITLNVVFNNSAENVTEIISKVKNELSNRINGQVQLRINVVATISELRGKLQFIVRE